jgi:hypothetical protein
VSVSLPLSEGAGQIKREVDFVKDTYRPDSASRRERRRRGIRRPDA